MPKPKDYTNCRIGQMTALRMVGIHPKHHVMQWECICDCGKLFITDTNKMRVKDTVSCGCKHAPNLLGQKFGAGVVIGRLENKGNLQRWQLKCSCGQLYEASTSHLRNKQWPKKYCGVYQNHSGFGDLNTSLYCDIRASAKRRGLKFKVTKQYVWELYLKQDCKCKLSGLPIFFAKNAYDNHHLRTNTASLDRIDSDKGYVKGNVQWVHKHINLMKSAHNEDYFLELCRVITDFQNGISTDVSDTVLEFYNRPILRKRAA